MGQAPLGTNTTVLPWARAGASRDTKASRGHSSGHTIASTPSGSRSRSTGPLSSATCRDRKEVMVRSGESDYPPQTFYIPLPTHLGADFYISPITAKTKLSLISLNSRERDRKCQG